MMNQSNTEAHQENFADGSSWDRLFELAESYEEISEDMLSDYNVNNELEAVLPEYDTKNDADDTTVKEVDCHTPEEALQLLFGYDSFRPGQKEVIDSILAGRDAFAVMPTGAGKSVCYQIPAVLLSGVTLVISPLISLMQDQVTALGEAGISAAFINSSLSEPAFYETVRRAREGLYKIIYVAPERLLTEGFMYLAMNVEISMLTVDEAHCISQWGQDFRPSYMKIVEFVHMLPQRPVISAFTATATENVREDIVCTLGLEDPFCVVNGFNRENLFFQVEKPKDKDRYILQYLKEHVDESGIIYCATRKNVDKLYELLKERGFSVGKYHAGMGAVGRRKMQEDFVFDYTSIVVATNAFGMGIDKSNVRFVIHYNMPQSMENYYQEAGRAGRDGIDAKCILLFSPQDIAINRFLLEKKETADMDPADLEGIRERDLMRLQSMESLTSAGFKLFDALKALRLEIAREESMPPYIIFSDKTLIDMAVKVPVSQAEMFRVSGVGEYKYEKYGSRFLALIDKFAQRYPELTLHQSMSENNDAEEMGTIGGKKKKSAKQEFFLTEAEAEDFQYAEFYYVNDIRDELNRICKREDVKKLPSARIIEYITSEGWLAEENVRRRFYKLPTEQGLALGIKTEERISKAGNPYLVPMYPEAVQERIVRHYVKTGIAG